MAFKIGSGNAIIASGRFAQDDSGVPSLKVLSLHVCAANVEFLHDISLPTDLLLDILERARRTVTPEMVLGWLRENPHLLTPELDDSFFKSKVQERQWAVAKGLRLWPFPSLCNEIQRNAEVLRLLLRADEPSAERIEEASKALQALTVLPMPRDALKDTGIGKVVKSLSKWQVDKPLAGRAGQLIGKWREALQALEEAEKGGKAPAAAAAAASSPTTATATAAAAATAAAVERQRLAEQAASRKTWRELYELLERLESSKSDAVAAKIQQSRQKAEQGRLRMKTFDSPQQPSQSSGRFFGSSGSGGSSATKLGKRPAAGAPPPPARPPMTPQMAALKRDFQRTHPQQQNKKPRFFKTKK